MMTRFFGAAAAAALAFCALAACAGDQPTGDPTTVVTTTSEPDGTPIDGGPAESEYPGTAFLDDLVVALDIAEPAELNAYGCDTDGDGTDDGTKHEAYLVTFETRTDKVEAVEAVLADHGFSVDTRTASSGRIGVAGTHESGATVVVDVEEGKTQIDYREPCLAA